MRFRFARLVTAVTAALAAGGAPAAGQTDYYNTDAHRPVRIEDAYPVERFGFELQLAPFRLTRSDDGPYAWELEPELAYGILPGTHVEIGVPVRILDIDDDAKVGFAGIVLAAHHNLNAETQSLPAFAVAADVVLPIGELAPHRVHPSVTAIATRTFRFARFHANAQYTVGAEPDAVDAVGEATRWMAGVAVDRAFPLRSALLIADVFVQQPLRDGTDLVWTLEAGGRYQLDPHFAIDGGIGRRVTGDERGWFITVGVARAFAIRSLMPGARAR